VTRLREGAVEKTGMQASGCAMTDATQPGCSTQGQPTGLTGMRSRFPGWNIWLSDEGRWWATRNRPLPPSRWPDGYALTLTASNRAALGEEIARQPGQL
jgi:hypothetical protein